MPVLLVSPSPPATQSDRAAGYQNPPPHTALRPHERVLVLLQLLGGQQRVELARGAIEAIK